MTSCALRSLLLLLAGAALWQPGTAAAEVRRCVTPTGQAIFTDRKCTDVGATERLPRSSVEMPTRMYRGGCARNLQDLVFEITTAIDSQDANRLAGVYHWPGMSGSTAYQVWSRLDTIVRRPLVDIAPVMPAARVEAAPVLPPPALQDPADGMAVAASAQPAPVAAPDPQLYPQTAIRRAPVALRVEQTLVGSATPARTVFGLVRHFGCWWVRL